MTTISDVNIVVQQGNSAREVQNTRTQPMDPNQATVAQQQEKESEQRTTVKEFEDPGKINPDQEREGRKKKSGSRQKQHPSYVYQAEDYEIPGVTVED